MRIEAKVITGLVIIYAVAMGVVIYITGKEAEEERQQNKISCQQTLGIARTAQDSIVVYKANKHCLEN